MTYRVGLACTASALFLSACSAGPTGHSAPNLSRQQSAIMRGEPAVGPAYDAIGALVATRVFYDENVGAVRTQVTPFCTASLISNTTVLTAKHCARTVALALKDPLVTLHFALGPDARAPKHKVTIVKAEEAPGDQGGFVHFGRDVAVVLLGEKVQEVTPLTLATLHDDMVGQGFEAVGYGIQNAEGKLGTRQKGRVKLTALEGRVFELALGDYAAYETWLAEELLMTSAAAGKPEADDAGLADDMDAGLHAGSDAGSDAGQRDNAQSDDTAREAWRVRYDDTPLMAGYEAFVGGDAESVQPCSGDSGGPLLKNGQVYGVASGVLRSEQRVCDHGAVYATFGPEVMRFLKDGQRPRK
jgi:hypothetical protein